MAHGPDSHRVDVDPVTVRGSPVMTREVDPGRPAGISTWPGEPVASLDVVRLGGRGLGECAEGKRPAESAVRQVERQLLSVPGLLHT